MRNQVETLLKLCFVLVLVQVAFADFSCHSYGTSCWATSTTALPCDPSDKCFWICGTTVINNQLGGYWDILNDTVTTINMHHPMKLTYQPILGANVITLQFTPTGAGYYDGPPEYFAIISGAPGSSATISLRRSFFDGLSTASKKHWLAFVMFRMSGQCLVDKGQRGYSWTRAVYNQNPFDTLSNPGYDDILYGRYPTFFIPVDDQMSAHQCMSIWGARHTYGTQQAAEQFLTFKPTKLTVYFGGQGFAGLLWERDLPALNNPLYNSLLIGVQNTNPNWQMTMAENEYISTIRVAYNTNGYVSCVGFIITDLDGNSRNYGGCETGSVIIADPFSLSFKGTGMWVMSTRTGLGCNY